MRRTHLLIVVVLGASACNTAISDDAVVARAQGQTLTSGQLLRYFAAVNAPDAGYPVLHALTAGWVDLTLLAEAAAGGTTPRDSGLLAEVFAPLVRAEYLRRLQNLLAADRPPLLQEEIDRQFAGDSVRMFQSILVRVPDWRDPLLVRERESRADSILALLKAGAPFAELARRFSEAPTAPGGGVNRMTTIAGLPPRYRGQLADLAPDGVSPVIRTEFGFEVMRRPPLAEVRGQFAAELLIASGARADAGLADSLSRVRGLTIGKETASRLRQVLINPDSLAADTAWIIEFADGGLSPAASWAWVAGLPDPARIALERASEVALDTAATTVARNELLYRLARDRGITVAPGELDGLRAEFAAAAAPLFAMFSTSSSAADRARQVDSIMMGVIRGSPPPKLPAGLAPALRRLVPHSIDLDAIAAVARKAKYSGAADSAVTPTDSTTDSP